MFFSPAMSLSVSNSSADPFDHNALANNWLRVDQHDHSQGRGVQIGTAGLIDNAVTQAKLAPGSVGPAQLAAGVALPTGIIVPFTSLTPPVGFLVCDGTSYAIASYQALYDVIGTAWGGAADTFNVPDLQDQFLVGAGNTYAIAEAGGSATRALGSSNMASHTHNVIYTNDGWIGPPPLVNGHAFIDTSGNVGSTFGIPSSTTTADAAGLVTDGGSGAASAFSILPPFKGVVYIIKT